MEDLSTKTLAGEASEAMIQEGAQNWELERIATTDKILMKMALAEAQTFESIPLKVTLNEYIELSKYYSTPKSHGFINGIRPTFTKLKEAGDIKVGRGLIEQDMKGLTSLGVLLAVAVWIAASRTTLWAPT